MPCHGIGCGFESRRPRRDKINKTAIEAVLLILSLRTFTTFNFCVLVFNIISNIMLYSIGMETNQTYDKNIAPILTNGKLPVGMMVVLFLFGWSLLMTLFDLVGNDTPSVLFISSAELLGRLMMKLYSVAAVVVLSVLFYGVLRRKIWARKTAIGWYIIVLGLSVFNIVNFLLSQWATLSSYKGGQNVEFASVVLGMIGLLFITAVTWVIGLVIIFYLKRKQDFFIN